MTTSTANRAEEQAQQQILDLIVNKDDVSWKQIIFELIDTEQMDPWDINLSLISQRFLDMLKKLKEMDFRISGKVVLASAILLKMKADRLHSEELAALDSLIQSVEEPVDLGLDDMFDPSLFMDAAHEEKPALIPKTPQPRKRRVSVYDLVEALEKALETEARRPPKLPARKVEKIEPPGESFRDISEIIQEVYEHIFNHYEENDPGSLEFQHLLRSEDKRDKVLAFIPLLHLENARKVDMEQSEHFGPIAIHLIDKTPPNVEALAEQFKTG